MLEDLPDDGGIVQAWRSGAAGPHTGDTPARRCRRPGAAQVQARGVDFTPASPRPAARPFEAPGFRRQSPVHDHASSPPGARGQHTVADEEVGFRSRRHRRQPFQELQRLEHQLLLTITTKRGLCDRRRAEVGREGEMTNAVRLATTFLVLQTFPLDIHGGMPRDGMS